MLEQADSNDLFGNKDSDEWNYPRTFLASDGNIVGICCQTKRLIKLL